jgi:hypothetical protein
MPAGREKVEREDFKQNHPEVTFPKQPRIKACRVKQLHPDGGKRGVVC